MFTKDALILYNIVNDIITFGFQQLKMGRIQLHLMVLHWDPDISSFNIISSSYQVSAECKVTDICFKTTENVYCLTIYSWSHV